MMAPANRAMLEAKEGRTMGRFLACLSLVAIIGCAPPSQEDARRFGTVRVFVVTGQSADAFATGYLPTIEQAIVDARAMGPRFERTDDAQAARVRLEHWESPNCSRDGAARWIAERGVIQLDPVCTQGLLHIRAAVVHELGHSVSLWHVCRYAGEERDCSPVGYGPAAMNPSLTYGDDTGPSFDTAYVGPIPNFLPTELDLAEARRRLLNP